MQFKRRSKGVKMLEEEKQNRKTKKKQRKDKNTRLLFW